MPLRIFANRNRSGAYAIMLCIGTAVFSMFFFLTQFLQNVLGWSPIKTGVGLPAHDRGHRRRRRDVVSLVGTDRHPPASAHRPGRGGHRARAGLTRLTVTSGYVDLIGPLVIIAARHGTGLRAADAHGRLGRRSHTKPGWPRPSSTRPSRSAAPSGWPFWRPSPSTPPKAASRAWRRCARTCRRHGGRHRHHAWVHHGLRRRRLHPFAGFLISLAVIRVPRPATLPHRPRLECGAASR